MTSSSINNLPDSDFAYIEPGFAPPGAFAPEPELAEA